MVNSITLIKCKLNDMMEWEETGIQENFKIIKKLGEGYNCDTYKAVSADIFQNLVALKRVHGRNYGNSNYEGEVKKYLNSIFIYSEAAKATKYRYLLPIRGIYKSKSSQQYWILQDYVEGIRYSEWKKEETTDLKLELHIFQKLLQMFALLHKKNFFVLDVKQSNFYITDQNSIVFFDIDIHDKASEIKHYPEGKERYVEYYNDKKTDIALLAIILKERIYGKEAGRKFKTELNIILKKATVTKSYEDCEALEYDVIQLEKEIGNEKLNVIAPTLKKECNVFIERDVVLKKIKTILDSKHTCLLIGEVGCGKSQTALEFAEKYYKDKTIFASYESGKTIETLINLNVKGIEITDISEVPEDFLVIIDNVEVGRSEYFEKLIKKPVNILVTTRENSTVYKAYTVNLEEYCSENFAYNVFEKNFDIHRSIEGEFPKSNIPIVKKILKKLNYNTLCAEKIGVALSGYGEAEFERMRNRLKALEENVDQIFDLNMVNYNRKEGEKLSISIQEVIDVVYQDLLKMRNKYTARGKEILDLLGLFPNYWIPVEFLLKLYWSEDEMEILNTLNMLQVHSWVKGKNINNNICITMHQITSKALSKAMNMCNIKNILERLLLNKNELKVYKYQINLLLRKILYDNSVYPIIHSLVAYEYGDKNLANIIVKTNCENITGVIEKDEINAITFMKGYDINGSDYLYLIAYDGRNVVQIERVKKISVINEDDTIYDGEMVWCWEGTGTKSAGEFIFNCVIYGAMHEKKTVCIPITHIREGCFLNNHSIKKVAIVRYSIGGNMWFEIKTIGENAFANCNIEIFYCESALLSRIEKNVFNSCRRMILAVFSYAIVEFENTCFANCNSLDLIHMDKEGEEVRIGQGAFAGCCNLRQIGGKKISKIGKCAFQNCKKFEGNIEISAVRIEDCAFEGCENLKQVVLANGIKCIGIKAFYGCSNIGAVEFPHTVQEIKPQAFQNCNLRDIKLYGDIKEVCASAFYNNAIEKFSIANIYDEQGILYMLENQPINVGKKLYMENTSLIEKKANTFALKEHAILRLKEKITIGESEICNNVKVDLLEGAFLDSKQLKLSKMREGEYKVIRQDYIFRSQMPVPERKLAPELVLADTVREVAALAYTGSGMKKIFGINIQRIGAKAMRDCEMLEKAYFPNINVVEDEAFRRCVWLKDFFGGKLKIIGNYAFAACSNLQRIDNTESLIFIGEHAFEYSGLTSIALPSCEISQFAFSHTPLSDIVLTGPITVKEGTFSNCLELKDIDWTYIDEISGGSFVESGLRYVNLNEHIGYIPRGCFAWCDDLQTVKFNAEAVYLDVSSFAECGSLKLVTSLNVIGIGAYALASTSIFEFVSEKINYIGKGGLSGNINLQTIYLQCPAEKELIIDEAAFEGCVVLSEIWINHDGVNEISENAFPRNVSIYVVQDSELDRYLQEKGDYNLCPVSAVEMKEKLEQMKKKQRIAAILYGEVR